MDTSAGEHDITIQDRKDRSHFDAGGKSMDSSSEDHDQHKHHF